MLASVFFKQLSTKFKSKLQKIKKVSSIEKQLRDFHDRSLLNEIRADKLNSKNPLVSRAQKCFSQSDEDGITIEILRRMHLLTSNGTFAEFGVGTGVENNTIILAALGWKGCWFDMAKPEVKMTDRVTYESGWITRDNVVEKIAFVESKYGKPPSVVSIDLDYNDYHLAETILEHTGNPPALFIVEYNAKIIPPIEFVVDYDPSRVWDSSDYFGASLTSYEKLFNNHGYSLVACNPGTGSNAFFINSSFKEHFMDIPTDIFDLYVPPRYQLLRKFGHPTSTETIEHLLR